METIYTNIIHCISDKISTIDTVRKFIEEEFFWYKEYVSELYRTEGKFDSYCRFPEESFQRLTQMLKEDKSLHIKVLSYELHNEYVCLMIYRNGIWEKSDKTFNNNN